MTKVYTIFAVPGPKHKSNGQSGGGARFEEIVKRLQTKLEFHFIGTPEILSEYKKKRIIFKSHYLKTKLKYKNYFDLTVYSFFLIINFVLNHKKYIPTNEKIIIYSSSDLFWETIPSFFLKLLYPNTVKWIQPIFHIYPNWRTRPGSIFNSLFGYYLQKLSHNLIKQKADVILTINSLTTQQLIKNNFPANKIHKTEIGIDIPKKFSNAKKFDSIFIGRLDHSKGIFDLIKITSLIVKVRPSYKLVIVGSGFKNVIKSLKREVKLRSLQKNIKLTGYVTDTEKIKLLKQSHLFISASHEEGWGIAISEAMSYKLPIITWNLPVYKSIYKDQLIVSPENNFQEFSNKVIKYLSDQKLSRLAGESNHNFTKLNYSWNQIAKNEYKYII